MLGAEGGSWGAISDRLLSLGSRRGVSGHGWDMAAEALLPIVFFTLVQLSLSESFLLTPVPSGVWVSSEALAILSPTASVCGGFPFTLLYYPQSAITIEGHWASWSPGNGGSQYQVTNRRENPFRSKTISVCETTFIRPLLNNLLSYSHDPLFAISIYIFTIMRTRVSFFKFCLLPLTCSPTDKKLPVNVCSKNKWKLPWHTYFLN